VVAGLGEGLGLLGGHCGLSSVVDAPPPETCLDGKAPPECGGSV
jgi:hypothetical protein